MTYTGYTYEELLEMQKTDEGIRQLMEETDTLVDGRFILAQRDLTLIYKGSRNQRIIDMNRTRAEGKLVLDPGGGGKSPSGGMTKTGAVTLLRSKKAACKRLYYILAKRR